LVQQLGASAFQPINSQEKHHALSPIPLSHDSDCSDNHITFNSSSAFKINDFTTIRERNAEHNANSNPSSHYKNDYQSMLLSFSDRNCFQDDVSDNYMRDNESNFDGDIVDRLQTSLHAENSAVPENDDVVNSQSSITSEQLMNANIGMYRAGLGLGLSYHMDRLAICTANGKQGKQGKQTKKLFPDSNEGNINGAYKISNLVSIKLWNWLEEVGTCFQNMFSKHIVHSL
jgi:hypothetical protein